MNEYVPKELSYNNNPYLKHANAMEMCSPEEFEKRIKEIKRCKDDIFYFTETYFNIVTLDQGKQIIKLYPKQREFIKKMVDETRIVCVACRQSGKTTSYSIVATWITIFNLNKRILIVADKLESAIEFLERIKLAYENLPLWLKPGIITWNKTGIELGNGSKIDVAATTDNTGKGRSIDCVTANTYVITTNKAGKLLQVPITSQLAPNII